MLGRWHGERGAGFLCDAQRRFQMAGRCASAARSAKAGKCWATTCDRSSPFMAKDRPCLSLPASWLKNGTFEIAREKRARARLEAGGRRWRTLAGWARVILLFSALK